ncbi:hypothetical protein HanRHA438_Chr17g0837611 [Helianthus annuus]|nr:hypothetical protein HanRHA438_Chr17g0837611 [Helianthus annuus]
MILHGGRLLVIVSAIMTMDPSRDYGSQQGGMMESNESNSEIRSSAEQMIWQVSQCHGSI